MTNQLDTNNRKTDSEKTVYKDLSHGLLELISSKLEYLSTKEKRIANNIISRPNDIISYSIAELAKISEVSEPTVHRFCQKFNAKGFPDFKLKLAQNLAKGIPIVSTKVEENDSSVNIKNKIFDGAISSLNEAKKSIDTRALDICIDRLQSAKRIYFCGLGTSATVAHALMTIFLRFGIPCNFYDDTIMMRTAAAISGYNDVFVIISNSGQTKDLIEVATTARAQKATVISITRKNSRLAEASSRGLVLSAKQPEDTDTYMPMLSTLVQMAVVDVLATTYIMRKAPEFRVDLQHITDVINATRIRDTIPSTENDIEQ